MGSLYDYYKNIFEEFGGEEMYFLEKFFNVINLQIRE